MNKTTAKLLAAFFGVLLLVAVAYAKVINFAWDANTETDLAGYKLYCGTVTGGPYTFVKTVAAPGLTTSNDFTTDGTRYCVLTAYDTAGNESGYSNQVTVVVDTVAPAAPRNFRLAP
jgi:hypothetical protein